MFISTKIEGLAWQVDRAYVHRKLNEAAVARRRATWLGTGYERRLYLSAAKYLLELAWREQRAAHGIYAVKFPLN